MGLAATAMDHFAALLRTITDSVPVLSNAAICVDSLCITGRAGINLYCSPNPLSKVFFSASCVWGIMRYSPNNIVCGYTCDRVGSLGARGFNRLGKYSLHMGNKIHKQKDQSEVSRQQVLHIVNLELLDPGERSSYQTNLFSPHGSKDIIIVDITKRS